MPLTDAGKNVGLNAIGAASAFCSLHTAIPNSSGSNEVSGGSYARQAIAWAGAASGSMDKDATDPEFSVPAATDVYFVGLWSLVSSGTFYGFLPINGGTVKGFGTAATSDTVTSYAHGLVDTDRIFVRAQNGESLPTGLSNATIYFVVSSATDTFKVALTSGGSAVDITGTGEFFFQKIIPESFSSAGLLDLDTATLDFGAIN